ncbi:hypothetical protein BDD12DRAFT_103720 [Trichophaea hybrida]|nr:hypothetical protein BDD12DRAFT_103720 [Trichophaea hybrida]
MATNFWPRFRQTMSACLTGGSVGPATEKILDWRYFYVLHGSGRATCGIVREAAARFLRSTMGADEFLTQHWHDSLRMAGKNPSVLGFLTEQMLLSWIALSGCRAAGEEFTSHLTSFLFDNKRPKISQESGLSLDIPVSFNYRAVNAIIVAVDKVKNEAIATGIQITISKTHSDSEPKFFADWKWWRIIVGCPNISFRLLWILEDVGQKARKENITAGKRCLRGKTKVWCPEFQRMRASVKDITMEIGTKLEVAWALR